MNTKTLKSENLSSARLLKAALKPAKYYLYQFYSRCDFFFNKKHRVIAAIT